MSPNCTTPARASSRRTWNSSPSARIGREHIRSEVLRHQHPGMSFGAHLPENITAEFVRDEVAAGRAIIPANIIIRNGADDYWP
ncbi:hypothetical protein ACULNC_01130 [Shigella flexneri]